MIDVPEVSSVETFNLLCPDNSSEDPSFDDWLLTLANLYGGYYS